jgi:hypothetical protein
MIWINHKTDPGIRARARARARASAISPSLRSDLSLHRLMGRDNKGDLAKSFQTRSPT